jgi:growth factor-regulated tyrosine kinase substrate
LPRKKTEEELREEEELQLALALSQSEAESKVKTSILAIVLFVSGPSLQSVPSLD